jgi:prepilin-type N-terminal cleavage/methylation domain-containing protein
MNELYSIVQKLRTHFDIRRWQPGCSSSVVDGANAWAPTPLAKSPTHKGFTLIELLVAIAIIATLASILLPSAATVMRKMQAVKCMSNQRQLGMAIFGFSEENDGHAPGSAHRFTPSSASVSWIDILNAEWFAGKASGTSRMDAGAARSRKLVCPIYKSAESTKNYGRPYLYNTYVAGGGGTGVTLEDPTTRSSTYDSYTLGMLLDRIISPSTKLMIIEGERATDNFGTQWPSNQLSFGSGGYPSWSANGGMWAFRHNGRTAAAALFCDMHTAIILPKGELNTSKWVDPRIK